MNKLSDLREKVGSVVHQMNEGWHELSDQASHAVTHFFHKDEQRGNVPVSRWSLLSADLQE